MSVAYIGVGGNLGNVAETIQLALDKLKDNANIQAVLLSSLYESKPLEAQAGKDESTKRYKSYTKSAPQPLYINAVARLETTLTPTQLLKHLQKIEHHFGRVRTEEQWASRTLDLDIVLFDDLQLSSTHLTIPHVGMLERDFVLEPLFEIAPALNIAGYGSLADALAACENRGLKKLEQ